MSSGGKVVVYGISKGAPARSGAFGSPSGSRTRISAIALTLNISAKTRCSSAARAPACPSRRGS